MKVTLFLMLFMAILFQSFAQSDTVIINENYNDSMIQISYQYKNTEGWVTSLRNEYIRKEDKDSILFNKLRAVDESVYSAQQESAITAKSLKDANRNFNFNRSFFETTGLKYDSILNVIKPMENIGDWLLIVKSDSITRYRLYFEKNSVATDKATINNSLPDTYKVIYVNDRKLRLRKRNVSKDIFSDNSVTLSLNEKGDFVSDDTITEKIILRRK